jgi:hypothetical protein
MSTTPENITYVALKRLKIGAGWREPGEEVPEARRWRNVQAYINRSMLSIKVLDAEQIKGGLDTRAQAGRAESGRPGTKPVDPPTDAEAQRPEVSEKADLNKLRAAQIVSGIESGQLDPGQVSDFEREREKPRKTVLKAAGWKDHEIKQGHLDSEKEPEPEPVAEDTPYGEMTDEQLIDQWYERYGDDEDPPDDREGLIADLEADDEADEDEEDSE